MNRQNFLQTSKILLTAFKHFACKGALRPVFAASAFFFVLLSSFVSCSGQFEMFGNLREDVQADISSKINFYSDETQTVKICTLTYEIDTFVTSTRLKSDTKNYVNAFKPGYEVTGWKCSETLDSIKLDDDDLVESVKIGVSDINLYAAAIDARSDIPYSVCFYFENAADDEFTMDKKYTITAEGTTGSLTEVSADEFPEITGFEKPSSVENAVIKGDGSTIVSVYYKRIRVTVRYEYLLDSDGMDAEFREKTGKYGAPLLLEYQELKGSTFSGWGVENDKGDVEILPVNPSVFPAKSTTYYPFYKFIEYAINYVLDGGTNSPDNPSSYTIRDAVVLEDAVKEGWIFEGWYDFTGVKIEGWSAGSTGIATLYAKWKFDGINLPGIEITFPSETGDGDVEIKIDTNETAGDIIRFYIEGGYSSCIWFVDDSILIEYTSNECIANTSGLSSGLHEYTVLAEDSDGNKKFGKISISVVR